MPNPIPSRSRQFSAKRVGISVLRIYVLVCVFMTVFQRKLLYFPSHEDSVAMARNFSLKPWIIGGEVVGYGREVSQPKRIWLMLHGNGGQAIDRVYALHSFNADDSVFILEYPGYGTRTGSPSKNSFNAAADAGFDQLRSKYPNIEVNVLGESLGSGAACSLASHSHPPDRIVLVVPFDRLTSVAQRKLWVLPIGLMLFDRWNNIDALSGYKGRIDIYGAADDIVIPIRHAKKLADAVKDSHFHTMPCGHNEWADRPYVDLH